MGGEGLSSIKFADINGDGYPDLFAITSKGIVIAYNNGDGSFGIPVVHTLPAGVNRLWEEAYAATVQMVDINGDGFPDIVVRGYDAVYYALNQKDGTFGPFTVMTPLGGEFSYVKGAYNPSQYKSFAAVNINGKTGIVIGQKDGIGFSELGNVNGKLVFHWNRILSYSYTDLKGWDNARLASAMLVGKFRDGNDDFLLRRSDGLYLSLSQVGTQ
jgi:hypothetical protein